MEKISDILSFVRRIFHLNGVLVYQERGGRTVDGGKATIIASIIAAIATLAAAIIGLYGVTLQKENSTLQSDNSLLKNENTTLQKENSELQEQISEAEEIDWQSQIASLQKQLIQVRDENSDLQSQVATLQEEKADLEQIAEGYLNILKQHGIDIKKGEVIINWMKKLPPYGLNDISTLYDGSDSSKAMTIAGKRQPYGIDFCAGMGSGVAQDAYAIWNTDGLYKTMTFKICGIAAADVNLNIDIDGNYYTTYEIKWDDPPKTITIPLDYALNVKLSYVYRHNMSWSHYGIYDISFTT